MFDARAAKLLQPGEHLTIPGCPGLRLEATQQFKTWTYRYKSPVDERMRQVAVGRWPGVSFAGAMGEWEKLRQAREAGRDPALEKREARGEKREQVAAARLMRRGTTVQDVCDRYVEHLQRVRQEKGWKEVQRMFRTMLGPDALQPAATYTRKQAFALLERHLGTPVLAGYLRGALGGAWDHALDAGDLPENTPNWWRQIMRGKLKSKGKKIAGQHIGTDKRWLTDQEVGELIRWLPNFTALLEDALTLYLWTGCRGDELMQMEGGEVSDEEDGLWWTCPKAKTKNARHENAGDLRVPLIGRAEEVVRRRIERHGLGHLFPTKTREGVPTHTKQKVISEQVYYHQPYAKIRPEFVRPRLPVSHWSPHDLRRTVRTALASMGCPDEIAEAVLGHMAPGIKGVYNRHRYDRERREWLTRVAERWEACARRPGAAS